MSIDFGFISHFFDSETKMSALQKFNIAVHRKIAIYRINSKKTRELYKKEFLEIDAKNRKDFSEANGQAAIKYKEVFAEIEGDEHLKHSYADHESGYREIGIHYELTEEALKMDFMEMADNFNKSSLIVQYALLESELRRLCGLLKDILKKRIALSDIEAGDYLNSIYNYLDKVIEIEMDSILPFQNKFKDIQYIRNRIVHNGGEFSLEANDTLDQFVESHKGSVKLEVLKHENIRILRMPKNDVVSQFYDLTHDFFGELFWVIERKRSYVTLIERITFLFAFLSGKTCVKLIESNIVNKGRQFVFKIDTNDGTIADFNCKLTIRSAKKSAVSLINQLDKHEMIDRLVDQLSNHNSVVMEDVLQGFYRPDLSVEIELLLYQN